MVLASGGSNTTVSIYYLVATVGGICLLLGYIANFISPFARKHRSRVEKLDTMLDGWQGIEPRPGFARIPGVPERLENVEAYLKSWDSQASVMQENIAEVNKSTKAAHRRQDEFEARVEREHGEKLAKLFQLQHDITGVRMQFVYYTAYIQLLVEKLREQGLDIPEPAGIPSALIPEQPGGGEH